MSTPNPLLLAKFHHKPAPAPKKPKAQPVLAKIEPTDPGKVVRPGTQPTVVEVEHDGVVKAKHLEPGQHVRPWLHNEARGSVRIVEAVTPNDDGSEVYIEFASAHPAAWFKAAYRWFDADLKGTTIQQVKHVPAFVSYFE